MTTSVKPFQMLVLAAAGVASYYLATHWARPASIEPDSVVEAVAREDRQQPTSGVSDAKAVQGRDVTLAPPQRTRAVPDSKGEAFARLSWLPPPPPLRIAPPPPPPPPVVPVAPPLPFTFVGMLEQGAGRPQAFLSKGEVLLVVAAGDILDNNLYRVDTLNSQQIIITYLPLNTPQSLNILGTTK